MTAGPADNLGLVGLFRSLALSPPLLGARGLPFSFAT
jgi:hypothetical protein